ncbi:hypothetical protein SAMN04489751_1584 [Brevibacterium sandarakinum]|uniref:DUF4352 domain-containing protein n=1 Tax=Brevibacterium sandarakinum TaxID=629680 RepID=A0A1H1QPC3_BRESA|nr:hypothetical protein SAMN04489751_1584 [Brevibacterium sandarakinum]
MVAVSAVALTGCTSPSGSDSEDSGSNDSAGKDASGAGVAKVNFDEVIVEQDVKIGGSSEATATIGVLSLKVEGEVQTLRLAVTPHIKGAEDDERFSVYDIWNESKFSPQLVDKGNLKVYSPISTSYEQWTSDSVQTETKNETPMEVWAVFAAPQDDIDSFDIRLADSWPVFTDVPVTQ